MTIEEVLRSSEVRTGENGFVYATVAANEQTAAHVFDRPLEKMIACVPRPVVERMGRSACYFVPWLVKQRRGVAIATAPAENGDGRKELCHHLDVKPHGNLLLISTGFYENDSFGLAMEFFDKVGYLAALERDSRPDFYELLRAQMSETKSGELTAEAWEWRQAVTPRAEPAASDAESWRNYERAAESDALGLYMASLYVDVFYDDLFENGQNYPLLPPDQVYRRLRALERLYPPNRGYSFQVVRQRSRRRAGR